MNLHFDELLDKSIDIWFAEDIGDGDHTTLSTIPESVQGKATFWQKKVASLQVCLLPPGSIKNMTRLSLSVKSSQMVRPLVPEISCLKFQAPFVLFFKPNGLF